MKFTALAKHLRFAKVYEVYCSSQAFKVCKGYEVYCSSQAFKVCKVL